MCASKSWLDLKMIVSKAKDVSSYFLHAQFKNINRKKK